MQVGDGLGVLAVQVGQQTLDVVLGVVPLLLSRQRRDERLQEGFQTWQHAPQQARRDLGLFKQFVQADAEPSLHRTSPFGKWLAPKGGYTTSTYGRSGTGHSGISNLGLNPRTHTVTDLSGRP